MKVIIAAAALIAAGTSFASAQDWRRDRYPYEERRHAECQHKADRLFQFERQAARDGRIDHREREIIRDLQRDLDRDCGRFRRR